MSGFVNELVTTTSRQGRDSFPEEYYWHNDGWRVHLYLAASMMWIISKGWVEFTEKKLLYRRRIQLHLWWA